MSFARYSVVQGDSGAGLLVNLTHCFCCRKAYTSTPQHRVLLLLCCTTPCNAIHPAVLCCILQGLQLVSSGPGQACFTLPVTPQLQNRYGTLHGGAIGEGRAYFAPCTSKSSNSSNCLFVSSQQQSSRQTLCCPASHASAVHQVRHTAWGCNS